MVILTLNFSSCVYFVVTLSNMLPSPTKKNQGWVHIWKISLSFITANNTKMIAQKMSKSKKSP